MVLQHKEAEVVLRLLSRCNIITIERWCRWCRINFFNKWFFSSTAFAGGGGGVRSGSYTQGPGGAGGGGNGVVQVHGLLRWSKGSANTGGGGGAAWIFY